MALSPDDLKAMYAKGKESWAKMTPAQQETAILRGMPSTYDPKALDKLGEAKGGQITRVAGKKVGKDDGVIPARKGEYVIRKSAVAKYGPEKMRAINAGTARVTAPGAKAKK